MSYITELKSELDNDPSSLGYAAIISGGGSEQSINQSLANQLNALGSIEENVTVLSPSQILGSINTAELFALTGDKAARVWGVLGMNEINPFGVEAAIFTDAFGQGSVTLSALALLRKKIISRSTELNFRVVKPGHVQMARAIA